MDDRAHVGLVDAHAEGDRGHDHVERAVPGRPPGRGRAGARSCRRGRRPTGARRAVSSAPPARRPLCASARRRSPGRALRLAQDPQRESRGSARRFDETASIAMFVRRNPWMKRRGEARPSCSAMSVLHGRCGGGGEGHDRGRAQRGQPLAEQAVVGPEVVPPLADAVGLVDRDERRRAAGQHLGEAGHAQALGGDEEEVEAAVEVGRQTARAAPGRGRSGSARPAGPAPGASRPGLP